MHSLKKCSMKLIYCSMNNDHWFHGSVCYKIRYLINVIPIWFTKNGKNCDKFYLLCPELIIFHTVFSLEILFQKVKTNIESFVLPPNIVYHLVLLRGKWVLVLNKQENLRVFFVFVHGSGQFYVLYKGLVWLSQLWKPKNLEENGPWFTF